MNAELGTMSQNSSSAFIVGLRKMEFKSGGEELTREVRITALEGLATGRNACLYKLERAVRLELTILELQSSALAAWRRAHLYFVFCALFFEVFTSEARVTKLKGQSSKHSLV